MPEWLHKRLKRSGRKKGLKGERLQAYIYSVLSEHKEKHKKKKAARP